MSETTFKKVGEGQIVIREYGDRFITAEIKNQKLTGKYHYLPATTVGPYEMVRIENLSR